eukprot:4134060-Amphidinium_carterae.1
MYDALAGWLVETLAPVPLCELPTSDDLREFYSCLGVASDVLQLLCEDIHMYWCPRMQKLLVRDTFMANDNSIEVLSGALASLWKFPRFCGSRWLTMGASSRAVVLAHASGF